MFWSGGAIVYIGLTKLSGDWIDHITIFSGYPTLVLTVLFILLESEPIVENKKESELAST